MGPLLAGGSQQKGDPSPPGDHKKRGMQGVMLVATYGRGYQESIRSPYDLLNSGGKFGNSRGPESIQVLMENAGATALQLTPALTPMEWRKDNYAKEGTLGHQGVEASARGRAAGDPANPQHKWNGRQRSTPQDDRRARKSRAHSRR